MKKVEKVSIAEISFTLDSDAYYSLKQYLDSLHNYYDKDPDGREIIADIEARIAELILERQIYTKVVSAPLIDNIIAQLGTPDQIDDEAGEEAGEAGFSGAGSAPSDPSIPRRLHRSIDGKILGGVCSGLAGYLDISVAWVRLAFLIPLILWFFALPFHWWWFREFCEGWGWVFFVTYIVLWIALPMARTPRQKLEARGKKITPDSIRQNLQNSVNTPAGKKAASVAAELFTVLGRVLLFIVKFMTAVVGFSCLFAAVIIFMCMMAVLFDPVSVMLVNGENIITLLEGISILTPVLFTELMLLCALLPLVVVGMALLAFTFNWRLGRVFFGVTLGSWAVAMIFCGIVAISNARFFHQVLPHRIELWERRSHDYWDNYWHERRHRIRADRRNIEDIDAVGVDSRDSVVSVAGQGADDTTSVSSGSWVASPGSAAADEAADEGSGRRRIEVRRTDE